MVDSNICSIENPEYDEDEESEDHSSEYRIGIILEDQLGKAKKPPKYKPNLFQVRVCCPVCLLYTSGRNQDLNM